MSAAATAAGRLEIEGLDAFRCVGGRGLAIGPGLGHTGDTPAFGHVTVARATLLYPIMPSCESR